MARLSLRAASSSSSYSSRAMGRLSPPLNRFTFGEMNSLLGMASRHTFASKHLCIWGEARPRHVVQENIRKGRVSASLKALLPPFAFLLLKPCSVSISSNTETADSGGRFRWTTLGKSQQHRNNISDVLYKMVTKDNRCYTSGTKTSTTTFTSTTSGTKSCGGGGGRPAFSSELLLAVLVP